MAVPVLAQKNQIIDDAATFLFFAGIALTIWGVVAPQEVLVFTKRRTRLWALLIGLSLTTFFIGIAVYAETGDFGLELFFGVLTIGLVVRSSRLAPLSPKLKPATHYAAPPQAADGPPASGQGAPPAGQTVPSVPPRDSA